MPPLIKAVRGTRDLLPPDTETWNFVEAAARDCFRQFNFQEIRTPVLEDLALFQRSVGEDTDIVSKEMFAPEDRGRYNQALQDALQPVVAQMCTDCQRRAVTNPLRVLDCKVPADQPIIETLPRISDYLDEPCRQHFDEVQRILNSVGITYSI